MKQIRNQARVHKFAEGDSDILKKYANEKPSLEFHIHEEYFRMGNTDNIISKSNPAMRDFLVCVAQGRLPDAIMEVVKDGGVRLYDGGIILQIYDHRSSSNQKTEDNESKDNSVAPSATPATAAGNNTLTNEVKSESSHEQNNNDAGTAFSNKPKQYRTFLRMTQAAMYEDFSVSVDLKPVPDNFFLNYESEILTAMNRTLNLQPILNPFLVDETIRPNDEIYKPKFNEETGKMEWPCRQDQRDIILDGELTAENFKYKPLHQNLTQSKSTYEKLMLIYSQSTQHSNLPSSLSRLASNPIMGEVPRFERFRFIESYRQDQKIKRENYKRGLQDQSPNLGNNNKNANPAMYANNGMMNGNANIKREAMNSQMMQQQHQMQQQQQMQQHQLQQQQMQQQQGPSKRIKKPTKRAMQTESPISYDSPGQQNKRRAPARRK